MHREFPRRRRRLSPTAARYVLVGLAGFFFLVVLVLLNSSSPTAPSSTSGDANQHAPNGGHSDVLSGDGGHVPATGGGDGVDAGGSVLSGHDAAHTNAAVGAGGDTAGLRPSDNQQQHQQEQIHGNGIIVNQQSPSLMSASSSSILYSAVVPAYKEAGNLRPLTERITAAMEKAGHKRDAFEVLIVDDNSRDGSVEAVEALKKEGYPVDILVRTTERGLSSAVIAGMKKARGQYLLCMDADLQHPPESVPDVFAALAQPGIEFTLGTRYMPGVAIDANWPLHRRIISWGARLLARPLMPFNALSDPMSGFFAIRRSVFDAAMAKGAVSGLGFKIALELFIKCRVTKFNEVGFSFGVREIGESKLTGKVMVQYLSHLDALMKFRYGVGFFTLAFVILALVALATYKFVLPMMLGTNAAAMNKRLV